MADSESTWTAELVVDPITDDELRIAESPAGENHMIRVRRVGSAAPRELELEIEQTGDEPRGFQGSLYVRVAPHREFSEFAVDSQEEVAFLSRRRIRLRIPFADGPNSHVVWVGAFRGGTAINIRYMDLDGEVVDISASAYGLAGAISRIA